MTISVTLQATSTLLDENLTCEFERNNLFTHSKSGMYTEQFLSTEQEMIELGSVGPFSKQVVRK